MIQDECPTQYSCMLTKLASAIVHSACSMLAFPKFTVEKVVPDNIRLFACSGSDGFEARWPVRGPALPLVVSVFSFGALDVDLHTLIVLPNSSASWVAPLPEYLFGFPRAC